MVLALFPAGFEDPFFTELERAVQQAYQPLCTTARKAKRAHQNQAQQQSVAWPAVDIHESASQFSIVADVPGMTPDDIHVELKEGVLTVSGEKKNETERTEEREGVKTYRKERTFNKFTRSFVLPDNTDVAGISANIDHGVLTLNIPKRPRELPRVTKIPVIATSPSTAAAAPAAPATPTQQPAAAAAELAQQASPSAVEEASTEAKTAPAADATTPSSA